MIDMQIMIKGQESVYYGDEWSSSTEIKDDKEILHIALRCRHDWIYFDTISEDMWCPDCKNRDLDTEERLEYLRTHFVSKSINIFINYVPQEDLLVQHPWEPNHYVWAPF